MGEIQQQLKQDTLQKHLSVERKFLKIASVKTCVGYSRYLKIMYLYHKRYSEVSRYYCNLTELDDKHNKLISYLEYDMLDLDIIFKNTIKPFKTTTPAEALGIGYVIEGSTLGSAILHKQLNKNQNVKLPDRYFIALQKAQPHRWNSFIHKLDDFKQNYSTLLSSAINAFDELETIASNEAKETL